jgi:hypothetical protein
MMCTAKKLVEVLHVRMTGKGESHGTLTATSDPDRQHLIGVEQFLKYEHDDKLLVTLWSHHDYPEVWDVLMEVWHHRDDDALVAATRQVIEDVLAARTEEAGEDEDNEPGRTT